ncbi:MAG TPA: hypothetical protein VJT09_16805 [Pyrinomonadaceae bacterium]|nr:hypothetical protein [Pyrinomonadaceae bacterium]
MQLVPKKLLNHPSATKAVLILILLVWALFLWRALDAFAPNGTYSSDSGIPVLMSNDERPITVFNLYYYAADRWGGWPFLVAQFIRRATGHHWSDQSLFRMQAVWIFVGVLALVALASRDRLAVMVAYLTALCLHSETRLQIFILSQLYAWQLTALLLCWYSLRRLFDGALEPPPEKKKTWNWKRTAWSLLAFLFALLAVWSSVASVPFLLFLLCLETLRAHLKREKREGDWKLLRQSIECLILIAAAWLFELLLKWNYHRHSLKHYGSDFSAGFKLDLGYLGENLRANLHNITKLSWWPLYLLSTLAALAVLCVLVYALFKQRRDLLARLRGIFAEETVIIAAGAYGLAVINFVLAVLVNHVRLNYYDDRFLIPTYLFGPISGLLVIFLIFDLAAKSAKNSSHLKAAARPAFVLTLFLLLVFKFPTRTTDPYYQSLSETALALAQKAPRGILMGGYWETYVFTSLQPVDAMTAVPLEGQEVRTPWTPELVRQASEVIVEYRHTYRLGDQGSPPERLNQYGNSLRLVDPQWYRNGEYAFALYANESR